jgi:hypothetical protein
MRRITRCVGQPRLKTGANRIPCQRVILTSFEETKHVTLHSLGIGSRHGARRYRLRGRPSLGRPPPVDLPPPPVFIWTGLYIGGNLGFGGDRFIYPFTVGVVSGQATLTSGGIIGGGQVGFNWQFPNNFLLGLETDFDGAAIRGKATVNIATPGGVFSAQAGSRINYIGTVRGRVGYAWDRFLIYGTGGFAYGQVILMPRPAPTSYRSEQMTAARAGRPAAA